MHARSYPEAREAYFGPTSLPAPAPDLAAALERGAGGVPRTHRALDLQRAAPRVVQLLHAAPAAQLDRRRGACPVDPSRRRRVACGPIGTFVEEEVTAWLRDLVGLRPRWLGRAHQRRGHGQPHGADGGPRHLAREAPRHRPVLRAAPPWRACASTPAIRRTSRSRARSAMLGFPDETLVVIESDERFRLQAAPVAEAIERDRAAGLTPLAIAAVAGSTNTGSVDDTGGLADVAERESMWLHVDAAYGGAARLSAVATRAGCRASSEPTASPSIRTSGSSRPTTSVRSSCAAARTCCERSTSLPSTTGPRGPRTSRWTGTSTRWRERVGSAR